MGWGPLSIAKDGERKRRTVKVTSRVPGSYIWMGLSADLTPTRLHPCVLTMEADELVLTAPYEGAPSDGFRD